MYQQLKTLLERGYSVEFTPLKKGFVELVVQEAKNGTVKGCSVEMNCMEWGLVEKGITARLEEAIRHLATPASKDAKKKKA